MKPTIVWLLAGLSGLRVTMAADLLGQPADISGSAYQYRADRAPDANPPESWFGLMQYAELPFDKKLDVNTPALKKVLCSLLWEEVRPVRKVELVWPAGAKNRPAPDEVRLAVCDADDRRDHHWWMPRTLKEIAKPSVSADGCTYTYDIPGDTWSILATVGGEKDASAFAVPALRAFVPDVWKRMEVEIEWGFDEATAALAYDGHLETYDAIIGGLKALSGDAGTAVTGAAAWTSARQGPGRRGVRMSLLYIGAKGVSPYGHIVYQALKVEDLARSVVTVWSKSGSFSFQADDLERGPILAPEYGFFVRAVSFSTPSTNGPGPYPFETKAATAAEFKKELAAKNLRTVRQRVRERPEPTWEGAMKELYGDMQLPPMRTPALQSPMQVEVPCARLTAQWKLGVEHFLNKKGENPPIKGPDGKWRFNDSPYGVLASETYLILRALDLMGLHKEAADGLDQWLSLPLDLNVDLSRHTKGTMPDRPRGLYSDGKGCFTNAEGPPGTGSNMDGAHGNGAGPIAFAMNEHFLLTRDMDWLKANVARIQANAEWILRQRRWVSALVPGGEHLWSKGLQPAVQLSGDNNCGGALFLQYYVTDAFYSLAVRGLADLLAPSNPKEAARIASAAEAYRQDIVAAVGRSMTLTPVVQTRDGTYRSFIPVGPYVRGFAAGPWTWKRGRPAYATFDSIWTSQIVNPPGVLDAADIRVQGYLDTMEDRVTMEVPGKKKSGATKGRPGGFPEHLFRRVADFDPDKDWYALGGFAYLLAWETLPNIYLANDDVSMFVRGFYNCYAAAVAPTRDYTFFECPYMRAAPNKIFEEAGFLVRFRNLLVMEEGDSLWLARATPRAWLEQGKKISVKNAPSHFGTVAYEIISDVDNGKIAATVEMPSRPAPKEVLLRFRHPKSAPLTSVTVNGKPWTELNKEKETIALRGVTGTVAVTAKY